MQKLAADVAHRGDFQGLQGIDHEVLHRAGSRLLPSDKAWLVPLRDGTFVEPKQQAKYDYTKKLNCEHCGAPDSVAHRVYACPAFVEARAPFQDLIDLGVSVPESLRLRLLPSRNPHLGPFRYALSMQSDIDELARWKPTGDHIDLLTDGSCLVPEQPSHSLSAYYAVVSATHDCLIAEGTIGGPTQSCDLAELRALIWSDSSYVASNFHCLMVSGTLPDTYLEEWLRVEHALRCFTGKIYIQHVPAHRHDTPNYQDTEEWTAYWNGRADFHAGAAHRLRPACFQDKWQALRRFHEFALARLQRYQNLHLAILHAQSEKGAQQRLQDEENHHAEGHLPDTLLARACQVDWQGCLESSNWGLQTIQNLFDQFGSHFVRQMLAWLWDQSQKPDAVIGGVFFFRTGLLLGYATYRRLTETTWDSESFLGYTPASQIRKGETLTVALVLRLIQHFFNAADFCEPALCRHINLAQVGIATPQNGVKIQISRSVAEMVLQLLTNFTLRRPVRRSNDLARPFV